MSLLSRRSATLRTRYSEPQPPSFHPQTQVPTSSSTLPSWFWNRIDNLRTLTLRISTLQQQRHPAEFHTTSCVPQVTPLAPAICPYNPNLLSRTLASRSKPSRWSPHRKHQGVPRTFRHQPLDPDQDPCRRAVHICDHVPDLQ